MGDWLNQVLAYALLDWSDALGVDTIAVYLGWQTLLVSESLTLRARRGNRLRTPSSAALRADFRSAMQGDLDKSFAMRMRQRYPPIVTPARKPRRRNRTNDRLHAMYAGTIRGSRLESGSFSSGRCDSPGVSRWICRSLGP
jgi:hypothetical protein